MIVTSSCHDRAMNSGIAILLGMIVGLALGVLIGILRSKVKSQESAAQIATLNANVQTQMANIAAEQARASLLASQLSALSNENAQNIRLDETLKAVNENMATLTAQSRDAELNRVKAEAGLKEQMENMKVGNESLLLETAKLAGALSNPATRGKYGETQLERLLEDSGLLEGIHFFKQDYRTTDARISKPDIKIAIPGGAEIFIDSKFPFDRFIEGIVETDKVKRSEFMQAHAKDLMGHVNALAKRGYSEISQSPDYVGLFAPFESILSEAMEADPSLLNKAFEKGVTIATPTTMMALLRTVAFVFNQSDMAHNAAAITELAGELLKRVGRVHQKIAKLGQSIKSTEGAYNDLIQSAEENMLRPARKMVSLGVPATSKLKAIDAIEDDLRIIKIAGGDTPLELEAALLDDDEDSDSELSD